MVIDITPAEMSTALVMDAGIDDRGKDCICVCVCEMIHIWIIGIIEIHINNLEETSESGEIPLIINIRDI